MLGDTVYSCGENLTAMEQREVELLAPLGEPKCKDNPALREDLSEPVAEEDLDRLPKKPRLQHSGAMKKPNRQETTPKNTHF